MWDHTDNRLPLRAKEVIEWWKNYLQRLDNNADLHEEKKEDAAEEPRAAPKRAERSGSAIINRVGRKRRTRGS